MPLKPRLQGVAFFSSPRHPVSFCRRIFSESVETESQPLRYHYIAITFALYHNRFLVGVPCTATAIRLTSFAKRPGLVFLRLMLLPLIDCPWRKSRHMMMAYIDRNSTEEIMIRFFFKVDESGTNWHPAAWRANDKQVNSRFFFLGRMLEQRRSHGTLNDSIVLLSSTSLRSLSEATAVLDHERAAQGRDWTTLV